MSKKKKEPQRVKKSSMAWYFGCLAKYAVFKGRAGVSEFWGFFWGNLIVSLALSAIAWVCASPNTAEMFSNAANIRGIYNLIIFLPCVSLGVRRFHDLGRSGWWYWCLFVPTVVAIHICDYTGHLKGYQRRELSSQFGVSDEFFYNVFLASGAIGLVCGLILLVCLARRGITGSNVYGNDPEPWRTARQKQ